MCVLASLAMGLSYVFWQIDCSQSLNVEQGLSVTNRACIHGDQVDLAGGARLAELLEDLGFADPFDGDHLTVSEVRAMGKTIEPLTWAELNRLADELEIELPDEDDYLEFRKLILESTQLGNKIAIEVT